MIYAIISDILNVVDMFLVLQYHAKELCNCENNNKTPTLKYSDGCEITGFIQRWEWCPLGDKSKLSLNANW